jgi:hypothetical protein
MITVKILEDDDIIYAEDWCRPLQIVSMSGGHSDHYSFKSCYTGAPENNAKWVKVKDAVGDCWFGKTVKKYHKAMNKFGLQWEFMRGDIPKSHRLNMKGYNSLWEMKKSLPDDDYNDDIPF